MNIYEVGLVFYSYLKKEFKKAFLNQYSDEDRAAIYLPEKNVFIAFDDDDTINYKHSVIAENNLYYTQETYIYRFRVLGCIPLNSASFDYYFDNLDNVTVLEALRFLLLDLGINIPNLKEIFDLDTVLMNYNKHYDVEFDTYVQCCKKYIISEQLPFIDDEIIYDGMLIGKWLNQQPNDFCFKMEINFKDFLVIKTNEIWDRYFQLCKYYIAINNDNNIPRTCEYKGYKLGQWISQQRTAYTGGKLNLEKIQRFESMRIPWNMFFDIWDYAFDLLVKYKNESGNVNVPKRETYLDFRLGEWLVKQRQSFKTGTLSEYRINRLSDLGVIWDIKEKSWLNNFELLKEYKLENGISYLPKRIIYKGEKLGQWVMLQIKSYRESDLSNERYELLDSIGFWDDVKQSIEI